MSGVGIEQGAEAAARSGSAGFRSDLEGLRGVAIAAVLAFHSGLVGLTGGFAGVDVFFVLSGFLITGLLAREIMARGSLSFRDFYARRVRRLLPAALVCIVVTVVASAILLPPLVVRDIAGDGAAAALYVSNIRFAVEQMDYFFQQLDPSPLLQYWSLGVEEQFYLLWPLVLVLAARWWGRRGMVIAITVIGVASLAFSVWLTTVSQPWAFYSLPSRAWQLSVGGLLAMAALRGYALPGRLRSMSALGGLAVLAASFVIIGPNLSYPGTAALLPATGTALVIAAGLGPRTTVGLPRGSQILALAPIRWLGRISYSLYLWHWPLLVLPATVLGSLFGPNKRLLAMAAIVIVSWLSWRLIEEPIHRGRRVRLPAGRSVALGVAASVIAAVLAAASWPLSAAVSLSGGAVPGGLMPSLDGARDDIPRAIRDGCQMNNETTELPDGCVYGPFNASGTIFLVGDSKASQWADAFNDITASWGWRLVVDTKSSCAFVDAPQWVRIPHRPFDECAAWQALTLQRLAAEGPQLLVIGHAVNRELTVDGQPQWTRDRPDAWADGLTRMLQAVKPLVGKVVVIEDTPVFKQDVPICLSGHPVDAADCSAPRADVTLPEISSRDAAITAAEGVGYIDLIDAICPTDPCQTTAGRYLIYRDAAHITNTFARSLEPLIRPRLPRP